MHHINSPVSPSVIELQPLFAKVYKLFCYLSPSGRADRYNNHRNIKTAPAPFSLKDAVADSITAIAYDIYPRIHASDRAYISAPISKIQGIFLQYLIVLFFDKYPKCRNYISFIISFKIRIAGKSRVPVYISNYK